MRLDSTAAMLKRARNKCVHIVPECGRMLKSKLQSASSMLKSSLQYAYARGYNAKLVCNAAYAGAIVLFLIGSLSPRLPKFSFPFAGNFFPAKTKFGKIKPPRTVLAHLFCIHFMRRILEVLFVHKFKREFHIMETVIGPVFCWIFSLWIAVSIRPAAGYVNTSVNIYTLGIVLFILGEFLSAFCYLYSYCNLGQRFCEVFSRILPLKELPGGILYPFESCCHLTLETLSWFGFFVATGTLSSLLFFLCNVAVVLIYLIKCYREQSNEIKKKVVNGTIIPINNKEGISHLEC
ncbi:trans-2,3-enoyl-CoA reductase-like [Anneissia japonica]|uniref:trans-2,3-enoyl-CoA reductase-like n=1 Tax=Anneissia japonica TaxID=1529436 RepID=UPI001425A0CB|nr:trans-2,3-enoyl-CoA reductase-like [Anneissia japonica]